MAPKPVRNNHLARIHILKGELGMSDQQYRAMLWTVAHVESSKDLDTYGREAVLKHLQAHVDSKKKGTYPGRPRNADAPKRPELKKIEALLTDAGMPWAYAASMARRMYTKDRLEFCSAGELAGIISALHNQAVKRLAGELEQVFGASWSDRAHSIAALLFEFPQAAEVSRDPQAMSEVLRWWRGDLVVACPRPLGNVPSGRLCPACRKRQSLYG